MLRFYAAPFVAVMTILGRTEAMSATAEATESPAPDNLDRLAFKEAFAALAPELAKLPLSLTLQRQFYRLSEHVERAPIHELRTLAKELYQNILTEIGSAWFLVISADKRENYEQLHKPFGADVANTFHEASGDIGAASRCLALDEWTACVFHLMRVLEHGLRKVAGEVGLRPDEMAHEQWKNVIDQIEKKIREMEIAPRSPEKTERLRVLSLAAVQFRYFKDAWRNHVSHSRISYDKHSAQPVWMHVRAFMEQLA